MKKTRSKHAHNTAAAIALLLAACNAPSVDDTGYSPATNFATTYCQDGAFPNQWVWDNSRLRPTPPQAATSGTPLVKQWRGGKVIASYNKLGGTGQTTAGDNLDAHDTTGGAFHRTPHTNWQDGDVFEVYPAVYEGEDQQPWVGPLPDNYTKYLAGEFSVPKNITIRGVTINGKRPVLRNTPSGASNNTLGQSLIYLDHSENITIENLEIQDVAGAGGVGKAAVYLNGAKNLTLRDVRIVGFRLHEANGIFGTDNNTGTLRLERVELDSNGGGGGPEHNAYINASKTDPDFTVHMTGSWTHGAYYGHLFKSRAQVNVFEGNYFMGSRWDGRTQTENYLADFPNGGRVRLRNNIFIKNRSGDNSNGMSVTYAMEGLVDNRSNSVDIQHNTFVAFDQFYDTLEHRIHPMQFFYPGQTPGTANFPVTNTTVAHNVFVGYCKQNQAVQDYRGSNALELNFNEIDQSFRVRNPKALGNDGIKTTPAYSHPLFNTTRRTSTVGAKD